MIATFFVSMFSAIAALSAMTVAQAPVTVPQAIVLNNGPCLDSPRAVPQVLQPPVVRSTQVLRIDKVVSTATMTQNEVIGFLYTLQDGTTWLGQRTPQYMSPAQASQINQVLASTHAAGTATTEFPPQTRLGVKTNFLQYFRVTIPPSALDALHVRIDQCVAWPNGLALPDPSM